MRTTRSTLSTRSLAVTIAAAFTAVVPLTVAAGPAEAATPAIKITKVYYDSPGADTRTNTSLNAEYVMRKNTTSTNRTLTGWTLRDAANHIYTFPTFTLKAGASVTIHTGKGTASQTHRYYNAINYVWNNTGDTAYLRNAAGTLVHKVVWTSVGTGVRYF